MEIWKDIPGYEGCYQASSLGRVRSLPRITKHWRGGPKRVAGRVLRAHTMQNGYVRVPLYKNGRDTFPGVHRLVLSAFAGPSDKQVNHRNGNKADNRLENLEWASGIENMAHAIETRLLDQRGEKHHNARLSDLQTQQIRELLSRRVLHKEIAKQFGVARSTITAINRGAIRRNV